MNEDKQHSKENLDSIHSFLDDDSKSKTTNIEMILKALNNKVRRDLLLLISDEPISYSDILKELGLESGSFYWHIKKMNSLVMQTETKEYCLSGLGKKAFELLVYDGVMSNSVKETIPSWFERSSTFVSNVSNAPLWLQIQQLVLSVLVIGYLFHQTDFLQIGTFLVQDSQSWIITYLSIILSLLITSLVLLFMILWKLRYDDKVISTSTQHLSNYIIQTIQVSLFTLPILMTGVIISLLDYVFEVSFISNPLLQFILGVFSIFLVILLNSSYLEQEFKFGYKDSMLMTLIFYYPMVLLSFLLSQTI